MNRSIGALALTFAAGLMTSALAPAEDAPNLQELERRLEAAKREQAAQAEAARRKAAAEAARATLVVRTDAACALSVNGAAQGVQQPQAARTLRVSPGEQLIECASTEYPAARAEAVKTVAGGAQAVVVLALAGQIEQARAAAERAREEAACGGKAACMVDAGGGILRQPTTGLEWTQADNGKDIDWNGAKRYCESKGEGWRLPSKGELYAIYDPDAAPITCGWSSGCKVSPLFKLSAGYRWWSGTPGGSSGAWIVLLANGHRYTGTVSYADYYRALCVRRS